MKILEEDSKPNNIHIGTVTAFQRKHKDDYDILGVSEPIDTDVLRVDNHSEFCLYLTAIDRNKMEIIPSESLKWEFDITFTIFKENIIHRDIHFTHQQKIIKYIELIHICLSWLYRQFLNFY